MLSALSCRASWKSEGGKLGVGVGRGGVGGGGGVLAACKHGCACRAKAGSLGVVGMAGGAGGPQCR